jgi:protein O-mannosyl-transferase
MKKAANKIHQKNAFEQKSFKKLFLLVLIIIPTIIYFNSLNNNFTEWDDDTYVTSNPDIRTLHGDSINYSLKKTFTSYAVGNYHPVTMLTYSIEYALFKLNPKSYHVTNLVIHLLNTLLVFYFIWLLTKQNLTSFITALLFAIHPMHVESVAWVAERKDVLYAFFSLVSLCSYLKYANSNNKKWLYFFITLLSFVLAVLSKAMAVCIPLIFILTDYFEGRKITVKNILEKVPYLLIAVVFGIIAIQAQKSSNSIEDLTNYNFFDRILFSCYGILMYLWKLFIPSGLSCFYNYPIKQNGMYPGVFYIAPFIILTLFFFVYLSAKKGKDIIFGFVFFILSIVLVLQILPVGGAIIADRYTYIPYIGIFFIIARFINNIFENKITKLQPYKTSLLISFSIICVIYAYVAFQRTRVWEDTITLFTDAIKKYDKAPRSYNARGGAYFHKEQYEKAIADYSSYIFLKNDNAIVYYNRGLCYLQLKKYKNAIDDFTTAIKYDPQYADAFFNRGVVYNDMGNFRESIVNNTLAIKCNSGYAKAYYNRAGAHFMLHHYNLALADALKAQQLGFYVDPRFIEAIHEGLN